MGSCSCAGDYLAGRMAAAEVRFAESRDLAERVNDLRGAGWALQHLAWRWFRRWSWMESADGTSARIRSLMPCFRI